MARKSKGFRELLQQQQSVDGLAQRVKKDLKGKVADVEINPSGEVKMSEVLEAFVQPYMETTRNRDQRMKLLTIATFAWNLTLLPVDQQQSEMERLIQELSQGKDPKAEQDIRSVLEELMERKQNLFPENKRYILDFELKETRSDFHLAVVSSLMPEADTLPDSPELSE